MSKRAFLRLSIGVLGAGALGLAGCAPQAPQTPSGGTTAAPSGPSTGSAETSSMAFSLGVDLLNLDPHNNVTQSFSLFRHLFDTLVTRDADLNLIPGLATSWKSLSPTTWEFKLREGVK